MRRHAFQSTLIALAFLGNTGLGLAAGPSPVHAQAPAGPTPAVSKRAEPVTPIDVNSASRAELKTLPGIDDAQAEKIIAGRPYLSKADLATKNVIPTGVFLALKDRIIARQNLHKPKPTNKS